jgi:prevent-host-death family protein
MKVISAREANQGFSRLLADVASGEEVVITSRGKPVAKIVPFQGPLLSPERETAIERMMEGLRQIEIGIDGRKMMRDEMHER